MRLRQLDALRGLAAATVVAHHLVWARVDTQKHVPQLPPAFWIAFRCFHPLFAGHEAVLLFFVLSGFVLTGAILRRPDLAYPGYVLHRICRIYLPYLAALLIAGLAAARFRSRVPPWTVWITGLWSDRPDWASKLQHALLIGNYPQKFNYVFWSLNIEMRISLLLPFLVLGLYRVPRRLALVALGVSAAIDAMLMPWVRGHSSSTVFNVYWTLHYIIIFALGVLLWLHGDFLAEGYRRWRPAQRSALLLLAFVLLGYLEASLEGRFRGIEFDFLGAIGAAGLIFGSLHENRANRALERRWLLWLGDVSFSLYLVHLPIILVLCAVFAGRIPYVVIAMLAVVGSLVSAQLLRLVVEKPASHLGRRVDRWYSERVSYKETALFPVSGGS